MYIKLIRRQGHAHLFSFVVLQFADYAHLCPSFFFSKERAYQIPLIYLNFYSSCSLRGRTNRFTLVSTRFMILIIYIFVTLYMYISISFRWYIKPLDEWNSVATCSKSINEKIQYEIAITANHDVARKIFALTLFILAKVNKYNEIQNVFFEKK